LLAEMVGLLATGVRPAALSQGRSPEEDEKRLATVLHSGDPVLLVDNCEQPVTGDFLCAMLTQEVVQARILGQSERRILPATALVLFTGNNLTFAGDMGRRAVVCRLDPQVERPETRRFSFDCQAELLAQRPQLVVDALTVLRAYALAGHPERLAPFGGFDDYAWIRGALVWLGESDPAETRERILDADPRRDELASVLELWARAYPSATEVTVGAIASQAEDDQAANRASAVVALRDKLIEVSCHGPAFNAKRVGWWLRRHQDRIVGGRLLRSRKQGDRLCWSVLGKHVRSAGTLSFDEAAA
jgi:hypothetical protein